MAELNSLYVRLPISKEQLQIFFDEKPSIVEVNEEWSCWWKSRRMHSGILLKEVSFYPVSSNRAIIDFFLAESGAGAREFYDEENQEWVFVIIFFSENYSEILPMLALLAGAARFVSEGRSGNAIIYDFYWGGTGVMAFIDFVNQDYAIRSYQNITELPEEISLRIMQTLEETVGLFSENN